MQKFIESLIRARLFALLVAICATSGAWAATLSSSGYISKDSANPTAVFSGVSLSDIGTKYVLSGKMGGSWVSTKEAAGVYNATSDGTTLTVQFQKVDGDSDKYVKCVIVKFTEATVNDVNTIYAYAYKTANTTTLALGQDFSSTATGTPAASASDGGYGMFDLALTAGKKFEFKTTGTGTSYTTSGGNAAKAFWTLKVPTSSSLAEGTLVKLTDVRIGSRTDSWNATYDSAYMCVTNANNEGIYSSLVSAYVPNLKVLWGNTACNVLQYKFPDSTPVIVNAGSASGVVFYKADKTYGTNGNDPGGCHVLRSGENVPYALNMNPYLSDTWRPVQEVEVLVVATATASADSNWSALGWSNGAADWTAAGSTPVLLTVTENCTITLDSAVSLESVIFDITPGKTLTLAGSNNLTAAKGIVVKGGTVKMTSSLLHGTVYGNGTLYYNGVRPTTSGTDVVLTDSEWRGTVRITYNKENTATGGARALFPQYWGSANSKIKWNGVAGYFGGCTSTAGWILEDFDATTPALRKNDGGSNSTTTAPSLEGDGEFADASNPSERFRFTTGSSFAGKITITSSSGNGMNVQFGETAVTKVAGTIHVLSGASVTVASGKTWSAPGGIVVTGTLTLEDSTSTLSGTVLGSGKIVCDGFLPSLTGLTESNWTGTVSIAADTVSGTSWTSGDLMNSGSTLEVTAGMLKVADVSKLTGSVKIDSGAYLWVTDAESTSANLKISDFSGTLYLNPKITLASMQVDIGTLRSLDAGHVYYSGNTVAVGVVLQEVHGDGGSITLYAPDLTNHATSYSVRREDGATVSATFSDGVLSYEPLIGGIATMYDITFKNNSSDTQWNGHFTHKGPTSGALYYDNGNPVFNNDAWDDTTGVYLKYHPYINGASAVFNALTDFTLVVVGQMSPTHKTQFIHIGSSLNSNTGLLISTTENDDEVIIAPNTGNTVDTSNAVTVSVPNAASARHAYVIIKSGSTFTVWVDGIKRGNFTVSTGWTIGTSDHAGVQVGSDFGGKVYAQGTWKNVAYNETETGVINIIRIFDYVISDAQAEAIVTAYPYVSEGGLYTRTISANANLSAADTWAKDGEATTYALPGGATVDEVYYAPSATVTVESDATLTVNADLTIDTLTVGGSETLSVESDGTHAVTVSGAAVVNSPLSITYGAVNLAGTPVQLGSSGTLSFDCSGIDISEVYTTTHYQLTGLMDRDDAKVTVTVPTAAARTATKNYNANGYYELVVTPDHTQGGEVYFASGYLDGTMTGSGGQGTVYLETGHSNQTILFPGDTMVIDDNSSLWENQVWVSDGFIGNIKVTRTTAMTLHNGELTNPILVGKTITVEDGAALTISKHSSQALTLGALTINGAGAVTLSGAMTLGGAVSGTATLTVNGTVTVASTGSIANAINVPATGTLDVHGTFTVNGDSTFAEGATVTGDGRMVFEGALPSSNLHASFKNSSNWTGTVELKNYTQTTEIDSHRIINLNNYGNSNSTVALNGVTSTMYAVSGTYPAVTLKAIEIGEGGWTDTDNAYSATMLYTAQLTGHGPITIKTGNSGTVKFVGNHTFDGSVTMDSNTGKQVAFMKTADDTIPSVTAKAIVVAGGLDMSIASGKTWTAAGGIKIDGSLTVLTSEKASATSGTISAYQDDDKIDETVGESTTTYESNPLTATLENSSVEVLDNQASMGTVTVIGDSSITGSGGAFMKALAISDGATLTYDPVITPLRVKSAPVFNGTGKLKLAARYAGVTCGKFHLVTYPSESFNEYSEEALKALVDSSSFNNTEYTVSEVKVSLTGKQEDLSVAPSDLWQLVLKVGDYDEDAKPVSIAQFGDSITEGIWRDGSYTSDGNAYRGTPNYRIPLMQLLEAYGYRPEARGYREIGSMDANGVLADDNYKWHTGISAQRIYTGGSIRAGFMESIEAHLEQVGVTDIITLKIGTNDAIGGESADNMFEGWSNLVWKIVRMRPTSKIVVCAPVKIRKGDDYNAPGLRTKIAEYVAKTAVQGGFPDGQVTMINGIEIVTDDADHYLTDNIHPNWNGHLQLANAWLPAVTNAFESMASRATVGYPAQTAASAADVAELDAYRAGYVKLATFTNFTAKVSNWDESPYVSVNDAFKDTPMSRVAYFVARKTKASPDTRYVWVDMDADGTTGTTLAAFGMPTNAVVNGVVTNLHIYSNSSAIENVAPDVSGVKGILMRTEKGVSTTNGISTDLAPDGPYGFDWNDSIYAEGAWGVMNVARIFDGVTPTTHRKLLAAQMLFDFNGFNGSRQNALGIGNFAVHGPYLYGNGSVQNYNLNWSFTTATDEMPTMDARALESGVIEIWGFVAMPNEGGTDAGYIDGTTAVITNTTSSVTVPAGATAVAVSFSTGDAITLTSESLDLATSGVTVYATDDSGAKTATEITAAFKVTAGANNTYTVELDDTATVGGVSVTPEVDTAAETAPMAFDSTAPVFTVKTIPGLWYVVASGSDLESLTNGTPEQADDSSRTLAAPDFDGTVQYYKVKVGPSKASVQ